MSLDIHPWSRCEFNPRVVTDVWSFWNPARPCSLWEVLWMVQKTVVYPIIWISTIQGAGLLAFTVSLKFATASHQTRAEFISPGGLDTDFTSHSQRGAKDSRPYSWDRPGEVSIWHHHSGWWFGKWLLYSHILRSSSSQLTFIFFRGVETTSQSFWRNFLGTRSAPNDVNVESIEIYVAAAWRHSLRTFPTRCYSAICFHEKPFISIRDEDGCTMMHQSQVVFWSFEAQEINNDGDFPFDLIEPTNDFPWIFHGIYHNVGVFHWFSIMMGFSNTFRWISCVF